ncbi:MAG: aldo/keto reductase [Filifactoraceae bacterium]
MEYGVLGRTGLNISKIGLGGIPIQRISECEAENIIKLCYEHGINFIDTARGYGVSESYIANGIKFFENKFVIATKSMGRSYEVMKKEIEDAMVALKLNYIDIYQMHNISKGEYELVMSDNGAYKALLEAKEEGKIKHIGFTTHSVVELEKAVDSGLFDTIQFPFNIVEVQGIEVLKKAKSKNIGTIGMKPLAGGVIDNSDLAIKYIMDSGLIDVIIPGMALEDEVIKNVKSVNDFVEITASEQNEIQMLRESLGENFCRRCGYCMPCPQGINIPVYFTNHRYIVKYGLKDWGLQRYIAAKEQAKECIGCMACINKCPYNLPIPELLSNLNDDMEKFMRE